MTLRDDRGQDSGDALICVDVRMSDVELKAQTRRASESFHQSTVANGEQRQWYEDTKNTVEPDVDAHQTPIKCLQKPRTLDKDRRPVRTRNGLDSTVLVPLRDLERRLSHAET